MRVEVTPAVAAGLWYHLAAEYGSVLVPRTDGPHARPLRWMLDALGVTARGAFLRRHSLTMIETIYVPFTPGLATVDWPPVVQVCAAVHEHHHLWQSEEYGGMAYAAGYLTDKQMRAHLEAEALRAEMELMWWLAHRLPDIGAMARPVLAYGCGDEHVRYARTLLALSTEAIQKGKQPSEVVSSAIEWLTEHTSRPCPA